MTQPNMAEELKNQLSKGLIEALVEKGMNPPTPPTSFMPGGTTPAPLPRAKPFDFNPGELMKSLDGLPKPPQQVIESAKIEAPVDVVKKLDESESLHLENLLLKEQLEEMRARMAKVKLDKQRDSFQRYIHEKHGINGETHRVIIDPKENTLTVKLK